MKKKYSTPVLSTFTLAASNGMLAVSGDNKGISVEDKSDGAITDDSGFLSGHSSYGTDIWGEADKD